VFAPGGAATGRAAVHPLRRDRGHRGTLCHPERDRRASADAALALSACLAPAGESAAARAPVGVVSHRLEAVGGRTSDYGTLAEISWQTMLAAAVPQCPWFALRAGAGSPRPRTYLRHAILAPTADRLRMPDRPRLTARGDA